MKRLANRRYAKDSLPPQERPTFNELQDNAEAGIVKRGIVRYFFTRNADRSVKMHTYLGTPLIRKAVMGSLGRLSFIPNAGNYRLNKSRSKIEAATNFAVNGSVLNEVIHTVGATPASFEVARSMVDGKYGADFRVSTVIAGLNLVFVALQRYNRARMIQRIDEELAEGHAFEPSYENWLGLDARAIKNYREALPNRAVDNSTPVRQSIEPPLDILLQPQQWD